MTRIGINGFGRMGRLAFRAAWGRDDLSIVHVNELKGGAKTAAHLLEFDSVHGRWPRQITSDESSFSVDGSRVSFTDAAKPGDVAWDEYGVDLVLECSGKMLTPDTPESLLYEGRAEGRRRRSRQAGRCLERRYGSERPSLRSRSP